jgi:putative hydrolase of the HAD superfamily
MKNYTTLIFDAFDTVIHINRTNLPSHQVDGQTVYTTAPAVHATYIKHFGHIDFEPFYDAFIQSSAEVEKVRKKDLKEVASQERFRTMLRLLNHDGNDVAPAVLDELTLSHMAQLQEVFEIRAETLEFLDWAATRFRRGMISNFDYAPALYTALDRYSIRPAFETIMVSVEVGWRKPHPIIFERTFKAMNIHPSEALYIGDQLFLDVLGAHRAGMDVVWLDHGREPWTPEFPEPTYRANRITEVVNFLKKQP